MFEQFTLSALASTTILLTPSILVRGEMVGVVEGAFRSANESLGIYLPNAALTMWA